MKGLCCFGGVFVAADSESPMMLLKSITQDFMLTSIGAIGWSDDTHFQRSLCVRFLDCSGCNLTEVSSWMHPKAFKNVEVLDLSNNKLVLDLKFLSSLKSLPKLTWLYLRGNASLPRMLQKNLGLSFLTHFLDESLRLLTNIGARRAVVTVLLAQKRRDNVFGWLPRIVLKHLIGKHNFFEVFLSESNDSKSGTCLVNTERIILGVCK